MSTTLAEGPSRAVGASGAADAASMVVAEGFTAAGPRLGLGLPLDLRGGGDPALAALSTELGFGWQHELRAVVDPAVARAQDGRTPWLKLPPLLLLGERGAGRTHVARRIAQLACLPHVTLDFTDPAGVEQLWPRVCGPDLVLPSLPVLAMAVGGCANPVVSVLGVECLDVPTQHRFAAFIEKRSAARHLDYAAAGTVDLTQVNWMVQGADASMIAPKLLQLLSPAELHRPDPQSLPLHVVEVLAEAAIDLGLIDRLQHQVGDALTHLVCVGERRSTAEIYEHARRWLQANCQ